MTIRKIVLGDNKTLADLIRMVFREFKIDLPGTVYDDPTTDHLFELFQKPKSVLWIAEENEKILGACGIYPTEGLPSGCAELVKFYLLPEARGKGIGTKLLQKTFDSAVEFGYNKIYLESFPSLSQALSMYQKLGFVTLPQPMGNSGHYACNIWMLKTL